MQIICVNNLKLELFINDYHHLILEMIYVVHSISFQTFFVQAFNIIIDSWKFSMLLLYILWDDWLIFMVSGSNEQLQQQLEHPTKAWLSQLVNFKNAVWTLEERYAIKFCFKLGKNAMRWKLDLLLWPRDQETEFPVETCWLSPTQEGQTEQIHPQTFDDPFFLIALAWSTCTGFPLDRQSTSNTMLRF